ncbi:MAG: PDZ domain-containing protein [Blautia sp.]|nr:PDZ domain-containing protein [Blautia sp.]
MMAGVSFLVILSMSAYAGYHAAEMADQENVLTDEYHVEKLLYLEEMIDELYLYDKDEEQLAEGIYTGLVYGLGDPYSCYYTAEEYEAEFQANEGTFYGIGISMEGTQDGYQEVIEVYEGAPADEAGMLPGDIILEVNGEDICGMPGDEVVHAIRDSEDEVQITVNRPDTEKELEFTMTPTDVEISSVYYGMLNSRMGYIQITEFTAVTPAQYQVAFEELTKEGMQTLVVDLRNNPGGLVDAVCEILRNILPEGKIVYTEDKNGERQEEFCDGKNELQLPLAVLVNSESASAAEIFAGAVQDYKKGIIIGTNTYGKGIVQSILSLSDGSAIKLTTAQYFTAKGNIINGKGICPDLLVELNYQPQELLDDKQVLAAMEFLAGKTAQNAYPAA